MRTFLFLATCLVLPGCIRTTVSKPDFGKGEVRSSEAAMAWKVMEGGALAGYAIRFEERGGAGDPLVSVRNEHNQDLGWVDVQGRAWRYRLHGDPEWIGTGNLARGVRSILELGSNVTLVPADMEEIPSPE